LAYDINERGQIVGSSETRGGASHAFLWQEGKMRDLGTLGGKTSAAEGINSRGEIVGCADTKARDVNGEQIQHAFLWKRGKMHDLGTLGGPKSCASDINDRGEIVGWADTRTEDPFSYAAHSKAHHAFVLRKGQMTNLGTFGGLNSEANAINERGQIVGWAETKTKVRESGYLVLTRHAFIWQDRRLRDLGSLYGTASVASDINTRGQVVGSFDTRRKDTGSKYGDEPIWHAFLWQEGEMRDLTPRLVASRSEAINDSGDVVGAWWKLGNTGSDPSDEAVLWQEQEMAFLPGGPLDVSHANAINKGGQVVGWSETRDWDDHAVLWTLKR
jgi:probable HAF family extracellular repeat protein